MAGRKRKSEVTDKIVAILEQAKRDCAREPTIREISGTVHCSHGYSCKVKKWWHDGMVGDVGHYVHHERSVSGAPRPGGYRRQSDARAPKIKVPCLGNAIDRRHYLITTYREVGGRKIPDARLCGACCKSATEVTRFEL